MTLLERYIAVAALRALGAVCAGLTSLFSLLEFVDQLRDVGKGQYRLIDALVYVLLTAPARLLQLMPASMLLACLFALGALATRGELTAMRAGGVSPGRIVGAVFKLGAATVISLFLVAEFVTPAAQQMAQAERASRLSSAQAARSGNSFWARGDHQYLNVRQFTDGNIPRDIYVYEFAGSGELQTLIQADHAEVRPDGTWLLKGVVRKQFTSDRSAAEGIPRSASGATRDNRIRVDVAQYDRARQVRTGHRPADLGDLDGTLGSLPSAVESYGHVRRIAELWFVAGIIRQRSETRSTHTHVDVKTERIGACPKTHAAVRDTTIEQRVAFTPHVEQMPDVESTCLDVPHAVHRIRQLAD